VTAQLAALGNKVTLQQQEVAKLLDLLAKKVP